MRVPSSIETVKEGIASNLGKVLRSRQLKFPSKLSAWVLKIGQSGVTLIFATRLFLKIPESKYGLLKKTLTGNVRVLRAFGEIRTYLLSELVVLGL